MVDAGVVGGHVLFATNTYGSGLEALYRDHFPPARSDETVVFTDLDLVVPKSEPQWGIELLDRMHRFPELLAVSVDFDLANWNRETAPGHLVAPPSSWSPRYGIHRVQSGMWVLGLRRSFLDEYLDGTNVCPDRPMFDYLHRTYVDPVYGRLPIPCTHLSWDLAPDSRYMAEKRASFYSLVYERQPAPVRSVRPDR